MTKRWLKVSVLLLYRTKALFPALLEDDDIQARLRNDFIREFKDRLKVREIEGSEQSNARLTFSEKKKTSIGSTTTTRTAVFLDQKKRASSA